jgi:hypothetical protein
VRWLWQHDVFAVAAPKKHHALANLWNAEVSGVQKIENYPVLRPPEALKHHLESRAESLVWLQWRITWTTLGQWAVADCGRQYAADVLHDEEARLQRPHQP